MGPSPDALWEVEGTSIDLRTVKIPQKRYPSRTLSIGTEVYLMVRYIWEKTDIWSLLFRELWDSCLSWFDWCTLVVWYTESPGANWPDSWFHQLCIKTLPWQDTKCIRSPWMPWAGHTCTALNHGRYNRISHFVTYWGWEKRNDGVEFSLGLTFYINMSLALNTR